MATLIYDAVCGVVSAEGVQDVFDDAGHFLRGFRAAVFDPEGQYVEITASAKGGCIENLLLRAGSVPGDLQAAVDGGIPLVDDVQDAFKEALLLEQAKFAGVALPKGKKLLQGVFVPGDFGLQQDCGVALEECFQVLLQQVILGGEMPVEGAAGELSLLRDAADGYFVVWELGELLEKCFGQPAFGLLDGFLMAAFHVVYISF